MEIIIALFILVCCCAIAYGKGHHDGMEDGMETARDIAVDEACAEARKDADQLKRIMAAIEDIVILPKEARQAIMLKLYLILDGKDEQQTDKK